LVNTGEMSRELVNSGADVVVVNGNVRQEYIHLGPKEKPTPVNPGGGSRGGVGVAVEETANLVCGGRLVSCVPLSVQNLLTLHPLFDDRLVLKGFVKDAFPKLQSIPGVLDKAYGASLRYSQDFGGSSVLQLEYVTQNESLVLVFQDVRLDNLLKVLFPNRNHVSSEKFAKYYKLHENLV